MMRHDKIPECEEESPVDAGESPLLAQVLQDIDFPAWIESECERSVILHTNHYLDIGTLRLDDDLRRRISVDLRGRRATSELRFMVQHGGEDLSVAVYPIIMDRQLSPARLRMLVVCLSGDESIRDKAVAWLFWSSLLRFQAESAEEALTPRQRQIYRLFKAGYSYKEIAAEQKVAHSTVRVQIAQVRKTLGPHKVAPLRRGKGSGK